MGQTMCAHYTAVKHGKHIDAHSQPLDRGCISATPRGTVGTVRFPMFQHDIPGEIPTGLQVIERGLVIEATAAVK
jgi:hypothetical protein